jgi:hypothetical protein
VKHTFVAAALSCFGLVAIPQVLAAPSGRCTALVLYSEELPYGAIGSWLVRAEVQVTPPRGPAFVSTLFDYVPWQMSFRRGDTFRFNCERAETRNLRLLDLVR